MPHPLYRDRGGYQDGDDSGRRRDARAEPKSGAGGFADSESEREPGAIAIRARRLPGEFAALRGNGNAIRLVGRLAVAVWVDAASLEMTCRQALNLLGEALAGESVLRSRHQLSAIS